MVRRVVPNVPRGTTKQLRTSAVHAALARTPSRAPRAARSAHLVVRVKRLLADALSAVLVSMLMMLPLARPVMPGSTPVRGPRHAKLLLQVTTQAPERVLTNPVRPESTLAQVLRLVPGVRRASTQTKKPALPARSVTRASTNQTPTGKGALFHAFSAPQDHSVAVELQLARPVQLVVSVLKDPTVQSLVAKERSVWLASANACHAEKVLTRTPRDRQLVKCASPDMHRMVRAPMNVKSAMKASTPISMEPNRA